MSDIPDGCEKCGIHHGGAHPQERRRKCPRKKSSCHRQRQNCYSLQHHSCHDEGLPSPSVTERSGRKLDHAPNSRVKRATNADFSKPQTAGGEKERKKSPRHSVI